MKIAILLLAAGRNAGGPETYEIELVRSLARIDKKNQYFIYTTEANAESIIGVQQSNVQYRLLKPRIRLLMLVAGFHLQLRRDRVDVVHCTFAPPPFASKYLFTMHCVSNLEHPEYYGISKGFRLNFLQYRALKKAKEIFCVSSFVRHELAANYGVPRDRTCVIYNGVNPKFRPPTDGQSFELLKTKYGITKPYILYVGKLQSRKNIVRLIKAYSLFRQWSETNEIPADLQLVLAGKRTEADAGIADATKQSPYSADILEIGYVASPSTSPTSDLPLLYQGAEMFAFPSLFEGFGIPLIEAMACGTPVLSSNFTSLPEVAGDAALLVDPLSVYDMATGMFTLHNDQGLRRILRVRGLARARQFTWEECAMQTLDAYERYFKSHAATPLTSEQAEKPAPVVETHTISS